MVPGSWFRVHGSGFRFIVLGTLTTLLELLAQSFLVVPNQEP